MFHDDEDNFSGTTSLPANDDAKDDSPFTERQRLGLGYGLRKPLPDREPLLGPDLVAAIELAIYRAWLPPSNGRLLLTILKYTDWRTHVCYRDRKTLLAAAGTSERRSRMFVTRCVEAGLLTRLQYEARHPDLRRGSIEWADGAWFLRWEATSGIRLHEALRKVAAR